MIEETRTLTGEKNDKYAQVEATAMYFGKMTIGNVDEVDVVRGACAWLPWRHHYHDDEAPGEFRTTTRPLLLAWERGIKPIDCR